MKLWLDDIRPAPPGWTWAKTATAAKSVLAAGGVVACSLDHDLGGAAFVEQSEYDGLSGYDLVVWMCDTGHVPPVVYVHTMNPVGGDRMMARLSDPDVRGKITTLRRGFGGV